MRMHGSEIAALCLDRLHKAGGFPHWFEIDPETLTTLGMSELGAKPLRVAPAIAPREHPERVQLVAIDSLSRYKASLLFELFAEAESCGGVAPERWKLNRFNINVLTNAKSHATYHLILSEWLSLVLVSLVRTICFDCVDGRQKRGLTEIKTAIVQFGKQPGIEWITERLFANDEWFAAISGTLPIGRVINVFYRYKLLPTKPNNANLTLKPSLRGYLNWLCSGQTISHRLDANVYGADQFSYRLSFPSYPRDPQIAFETETGFRTDSQLSNRSYALAVLCQSLEDYRKTLRVPHVSGAETGNLIGNSHMIRKEDTPPVPVQITTAGSDPKRFAPSEDTEEMTRHGILLDNGWRTWHAVTLAYDSTEDDLDQVWVSIRDVPEFLLKRKDHVQWSGRLHVRVLLRENGKETPLPWSEAFDPKVDECATGESWGMCVYCVLPKGIAVGRTQLWLEVLRVYLRPDDESAPTQLAIVFDVPAQTANRK